MQGYVGALKEVALSLENIRGEVEAHKTGDWQPHLGYDFGPKIERSNENSGKGRIEEISDSVIVKEWSEGGIPLYITKLNAKTIFHNIFGKLPSGIGEPIDPYVFSLQNDNNHDTFTVTTYDPINGIKVYSFGSADTIEFDLVSDSYSKATLGMKAGKESTGSGTPAYATDDHIYTPSEVTVKIADSYDDIESAEEIYCQNVKLTVAKNVEQKFVLGSTEPYNNINQRIGITGDFTKMYEDDTFRTLGLSDAIRALRIKLSYGIYYYAQIDLPSVKFQDWNDGEDLDAYMEETYGFVAQKVMSYPLISGKVVDSIP